MIVFVNIGRRGYARVTRSRGTRYSIRYLRDGRTDVVERRRVTRIADR